MGNNSAFTAFEHTVMGAYKLGRLDKQLLSVLMEPYDGVDIDSGGKMDLQSEDGLEVEEVCLKIWGTLPDKPKPANKSKAALNEWKGAMEDYWEEVHELFNELTAEFGW